MSEAVTLMGINSLKVLVLSSSVLNLMGRKELAERQTIKRLCRHMIEVAATARKIAENCDSGDPEESFVGGMLHDVGIIVMILFFKEKYFDLIGNINAQKLGFLKAEKEVFGCDHCEVGEQLIEGWKLPQKFSHIARNHHNPDAPRIIPADATLNDIIALADRITLGAFEDNVPDIEADIEFIQAVSKRLGLDNDSLNNIRKESIVQSIKLAEYLELDTGDLIDIVSEANNKLAELYMSLEKIYLEKQDLQKQLETVPAKTEPAPV